MHIKKINNLNYKFSHHLHNNTSGPVMIKNFSYKPNPKVQISMRIVVFTSYVQFSQIYKILVELQLLVAIELQVDLVFCKGNSPSVLVHLNFFLVFRSNKSNKN